MANNSKSKRKAKGRGRPTKYEPAVVNAILRHTIAGTSIRRIAAMPSMPTLSTIFLWRQKHPDFSDQLERAREFARLVHDDDCVDIADDADEQTVQLAALRIRVRQARVNRQASRSLSIKQEISGPAGAPVAVQIDEKNPLSRLSNEKITELFQRIMKGEDVVPELSELED